MDQFGTHAASALANLDTSNIDPDVHVVLEQQVLSGDEIIDHYHVVVANGSVSVEPGPADNADVILRQSADTAQALRDGSLHAQAAFLTGRLSIDGDVNRLLEHGPLLAQLLSSSGA